jgi:hypothetical protein
MEFNNMHQQCSLEKQAYLVRGGEEEEVEELFDHLT